ncbi:MAG TPA: hemerythrin family protein [Anaeromyxobacter sp.]|nr:hemerythrin family protein [Anaeromyxobacter sp.]
MGIFWTNALAIGHPEIDAQHEQLFRHVGELVEEVGRRIDGAEAARLFAFLDDYVVGHFQAEEGLMLRSCYPDLPSHHVEHAWFVRAYRDLRERLEAREPGAEDRLRTWMVDWLKGHVVGSDKAFALFLETVEPRRGRTAR